MFEKSHKDHKKDFRDELSINSRLQNICFCGKSVSINKISNDKNTLHLCKWKWCWLLWNTLNLYLVHIVDKCCLKDESCVSFLDTVPNCINDFVHYKACIETLPIGIYANGKYQEYSFLY